MHLFPSAHFRQRCAERLPGVDPVKLAEGISWAIRNGRDDLIRFKSRLDRFGRRAFEFDWDGKTYVIVINSHANTLITILDETMDYKPHGTVYRKPVKR